MKLLDVTDLGVDTSILDMILHTKYIYENRFVFFWKTFFPQIYLISCIIMFHIMLSPVFQIDF